MARVNFEKLIEAWDPIVKRAFLDSVSNMRSNAKIEEIVAAIERGDIDAALRGVGLDPVSLRPFDKALQAAFEAGGNATATNILSSARASRFSINFQFNVRNPVAERWILDYSSQHITEVISDTKSMIRDFLSKGLERGDNPRKTALDLVGRIGDTGTRQGGLIGLTKDQSGWVQAYADELSSGSLSALNRKLRDRRFDSLIRRTFENDDLLSADQITKIVSSYKNRALRYRAENISRTETLTAIGEAQDQAMEQAVRDGTLAGDAVSFIWRATKDKRTRDTHRSMDGQTVQMGEKFTSPSGARLEYPGDPNAPAGEIINCRCWREPHVDFAKGLT